MGGAEVEAVFILPLGSRMREGFRLLGRGPRLHTSLQRGRGGGRWFRGKASRLHLSLSLAPSGLALAAGPVARPGLGQLRAGRAYTPHGVQLASGVQSSLGSQPHRSASLWYGALSRDTSVHLALVSLDNAPQLWRCFGW